jgi:hypothetical protein
VNLNFLEPSGPLHACNGTALPFYIYNSIQHNGDVLPGSVWQTLLGAAVLLCWRYNCWAKIHSFHPAQLFVTQLLLLYNKHDWLFGHVSTKKIPHFFSILMRYGHFHPTAFSIVFCSFSAVLELFVPLKILLVCVLSNAHVSDSIAHISPALFPNFTQNFIVNSLR